MLRVCIATLLFLSNLMLASCTNYKCKRIEKTEFYGFDIAKMALYIDVGECALIDEVTGNTTTCEVNDTNCGHCVPEAHDMRQFNDRSGPFTIPIIRNCVMRKPVTLESCTRVSRIVYYYPNSEYEKRVNLGECAGPCNSEVEENQCLPVRTKTKAIKGPNGWTSDEIIVDCGCADEKCYRKVHVESFWHYYDDGERRKREPKSIDVGHCIGECTGVMIPGECVIELAGNCIIYNPSYPAKCVPTVHTTEQYADRNMQNITVSTVAQCGCSSG